LAAQDSSEPANPEDFTRAFDMFYSRFATLYDWAVKVLPFWKSWLRQTLPHLKGGRVLEVSFGTGYLLTQYAGRFEAHGVDLNGRMVRIALRNVARAGLSSTLLRARVEALPYRDASFDNVLNTMAFSGYPDGRRALAEMIRVLKPGGRLVLLDVRYPEDGNWLGTELAYLWRATGDRLRDVRALVEEFGLRCEEAEVGAWGSVHLYLATRPQASAAAPKGQQGNVSHPA
jgi:ubiquinone/menaquinone biosynthesis C-methylase UbiE